MCWAIVNHVPKLGIVLEETLIELSLLVRDKALCEFQFLTAVFLRPGGLGSEVLDAAKALGSFAMAGANHRFNTFRS
jgi:hypothetical protein